MGKNRTEGNGRRIAWREDRCFRLSYSPYDQVKVQEYPAMLRALRTDSNSLLFPINMEAGHGGQSGRFRRYRETVMEYAFMLDLIGIRE